MAKTLGPVALKLGDEVLVKVRGNTTVSALLAQLDKACKDGRIQDVHGYDIIADQLQDLPEGEYTIKQPITGQQHAQTRHIGLLCDSMCYESQFMTQHNEQFKCAGKRSRSSGQDDTKARRLQAGNKLLHVWSALQYSS